MFDIYQNPKRVGVRVLVVLWLMMAAIIPLGAKNKKTEAAGPVVIGKMDTSGLVWPGPPAITRVKYLTFFDSEKQDDAAQPKVKAGWMDRLAGASDAPNKGPNKVRFHLGSPYGLAVDSKGRLYVADTKVGAIFVFNTETGDVDLIKNGQNAKFGSIYGLAFDDNDRLFVVDAYLRHVLILSPGLRKPESQFGDGFMQDPAGIAIDTENRLVYVADAGRDQVLVYDADSLQLVRTIGTTGKGHTLTTPGDFSKPTNVAVDKDGNVYVADTMNDRIEVFDADGDFIREFGKNGDGVGEFARPKGIAIDCDGHVWVADAMLNRIQVFTPEGEPRLAMGQFGVLPGSFQALTGIAIDKNNRVFTAEQLYGRVQMFRYITNEEAQKEMDRRTEAKKAAAGKGTAPAEAPARVEAPKMSLAQQKAMAQQPANASPAAEPSK